MLRDMSTHSGKMSVKRLAGNGCDVQVEALIERPVNNGWQEVVVVQFSDGLNPDEIVDVDLDAGLYRCSVAGNIFKNLNGSFNFKVFVQDVETCKGRNSLQHGQDAMPFSFDDFILRVS